MSVWQGLFGAERGARSGGGMTGRAALAATMLAASIIGTTAAGGEPPPLPLRLMLPADPQSFWERLFGEPSADERAALDAVAVTPQEERQLGQTALHAYLGELQRQGISVVRRGPDVEYLRQLVNTLRPLMTNAQRYPRIDIVLAQSSVCDARVFPGGALVLFGGLLETAGSEAAVVGLLGHELAHLDHGHVLTRIRRIKLAQQSLAHGTAGMTPDRFLELGASSVRIWTRPFQPEDELQADRQGARWAYQAGYDPRETGRLFVEAENRRGVAPLLLPEFLRSHPPAVIRQEAIATVVAELQRQAPQAPLYIGRENLRQRIPKSRREMPSTS